MALPPLLADAEDVVSDELVADLAATQRGVVAHFQLLALGVHSNLIDRRLAAGRWRRLAPGVYGLPSHPESWDQRIWVAYLAAGIAAVVSHETAASDQRLRAFRRDEIALTVPHPQHQRVAGATVHQSRYLPEHHWVNLYGRRTTTIARTLVDLAATTSRPRLESAYEDAILTDRLTHASMTRCFTELLRPGRKGLTKLAAILDDRGPGHIPAASHLEALLFEACDLAGLRPVRQHPLPSHEHLSGCVDAALPPAKLILEADGRRWHNRVADHRRDRARDKAAARLGWATLRFCHEELTHDLEAEADTIRVVHDERLALLRAAS